MMGGKREKATEEQEARCSMIGSTCHARLRLPGFVRGVVGPLFELRTATNLMFDPMQYVLQRRGVGIAMRSTDSRNANPPCRAVHQ